jgi:beta-ureidopropionase
MANIVKAALLQTDWTGDKESMIVKHEEAAREAAAQGAQIICFQELFYGPYFCQVQDAEYYEYTEYIPDGPTTKRFQALAKELNMVMVLPMYEIEQPGVYYNTAAVIDADGTYLGKYRKQHIPQVKGFWEKFYFKPGNGGYPIFDTAVGKVGVYICLQSVSYAPRTERVPLVDRTAGCGRGQHVLRRCNQPGGHRAAR